MQQKVYSKKKIKDELRIYLSFRQDLFLLDWIWKMWGRSTRRFIFQANGKKRVLFVGSNGNPFFLHYHVKAIILLIFTNSTWFFGSLHEFFTALHKFKPFSVLPTGCWQKTFFESCSNCFCKIVYFWIPTIFWVLQMFPKHSNL